MSENAVKIEEGQVFSGINAEGFNREFSKKVEGRKVLIKRVYKRMGASERSFVCIFMANTSRQKDFEHTFGEYEKLAGLLIP